jgi:aspartate aminotransferase-like enzyme
VHEYKVAWGESADPAAIAKLVKTHPAIKAVFLQGSETSTGVWHPVKEIAAAVHAAGDALVCVDAITALGVSDLPMDAWGLDVVLSGSQKALMLPPGLAFLALSERARAARSRANLKSFYFDLAAEDKMMAKGQTAWTPAVSLLVGLDVVLQRMRERGLPKLFAHHRRLAEGTRRGVKALGLELLAKTSPADSVTAVLVPSSVDGKKVITHLRDQYAITIAEGQDAYAGKMFRIAHLGYFDELDMLTILSAVEMTLAHLGLRVELGRGVGAAAKFFMEAGE